MGKVDFRTAKTKNLQNPRDRAPLTKYYSSPSSTAHEIVKLLTICLLR